MTEHTESHAEAGTPTHPVLGDSVRTSHVFQGPTGPLEYTAVAGKMIVHEEVFTDGTAQGIRPAAEVFVTALTLDGADPGTRPVTFAFNGGPGSPTLWLQFGLFGPRLIDSGDVDSPTPAPYRMLDNPDSLLADSDLVFIDPMTTGYSRAAEGAKPDTWHGYSGDRDLVGEAIRLWTTENQRWFSPKFLAGESYGTTRAAELSGYLMERHGMTFNGLILISSILDFGTVFFTEGNDEPYIQYLPTYAATAHYHGKHPGKTLHEVVAEADAYAQNEYRIALARGNRMSEAETRQVAERVAELTGLRVEYVIQSELRLEHERFFTELLREEGRSVGRLDSRFTGHPGRLNQEAQRLDPALLFILQAYSPAANHYFRAELGYETPLSYEIMYGRVMPWSYREFENASVTSADQLALAMRANPDLKVYVANGFYDGATPFAAAEHVFAHLRIPRERAAQDIITYYYEAGHMMYVHEPSRIAQSQHIRDFVAWACGADKPVVPAEHTAAGAAA
ncbi:S10 family peptidase [Leucobacter sp. M11]|uniref:S10 family peptidase n=1 Tax=Leucobacter sp. M11 TaxID=2993565 RepID=UPI002D80B1DC|nr:peptidase S10 [Leucobacter sp. M11]MEB4613361.1 peptidase S10 [Leucobacter sp. M11]